jgi:hypothetical protein
MAFQGAEKPEQKCGSYPARDTLQLLGVNLRLQTGSKLEKSNLQGCMFLISSGNLRQGALK